MLYCTYCVYVTIPKTYVKLQALIELRINYLECLCDVVGIGKIVNTTCMLTFTQSKHQCDGVYLVSSVNIIC